MRRGKPAGTRRRFIIDGPDCGAAYGSDVLPGETVGEYRARKDAERRTRWSDRLWVLSGLVVVPLLSRLFLLALSVVAPPAGTFFPMTLWRVPAVVGAAAIWTGFLFIGACRAREERAMDWAGIWKRDLQEKHPSLYRQWSGDGSLDRRAREVAQQANQAVSHLVNEELSHRRLPSGFVAAAGALNSIYAQAREIVLHDVVLS